MSTERLACLEGPSEGRLNEEEGTRRLRRQSREAPKEGVLQARAKALGQERI